MSSILLPALVLMIVTMLVWLNMLIRRIIYTKKHAIDPQQLVTPEQVVAVYDERTNAPGNCFKNLFEMPVLFYTLCAFIAMTGASDPLLGNLAWAYVGLRALQACVHCTYNKVMHRFYAYLASSIVLFVMLVRFFLAMI